MTLSDGEKLILIMLSDLYKQLKIKGDIDPNFVQETIWGDKLWGFSWKYSGIPFAKEDTPQEVTETANFLDMWYLIEISYDKLDAVGKKMVDTDAAPYAPHFEGFDGNHENHMGIARYFIEQLQRWEHFKGRNLNSHSTSVPRYTRMYRLFEPMRAGLAQGTLSASQIITLLKP